MRRILGRSAHPMLPNRNIQVPSVDVDGSKNMMLPAMIQAAMSMSLTMLAVS